jgi:hypothetical protein
VSDWVIVAPNPGSLADLAADDRWQPLDELRDRVVWTDDFSDILGVLK